MLHNFSDFIEARKFQNSDEMNTINSLVLSLEFRRNLKKKYKRKLLSYLKKKKENWKTGICEKGGSFPVKNARTQEKEDLYKMGHIIVLLRKF